MNNHTCQHCKFFERKGTKEYGRCKSIKLISWRHPEKDEISVVDYQGYSAIITVGIDFGCVHFQQKI